MLPTSGIIYTWTEDSEERITSIFRVKNQLSRKSSCSKWLGRILLVHIRTTRRYIQEDCNIHDCFIYRLHLGIFNFFKLQMAVWNVLTLIKRNNVLSQQHARGIDTECGEEPDVSIAEDRVTTTFHKLLSVCESRAAGSAAREDMCFASPVLTERILSLVALFIAVKCMTSL
jgi:hypothetical protein